MSNATEMKPGLNTPVPELLQIIQIIKPIMKKQLRLFSLLGLLMVSAVVCAQEASGNRVVLSDLQTDNYGTYFTVGLADGTATYTAFNMDITMPEGVDVAYYNEAPDVAIHNSENTIFPVTTDRNGNKIWKHTVTSTYGAIAPRMLRIACYSTELAEFTGTTGDLLIIYVEIDEDVLKDSFSPKPIVTVSGIKFVTKDEKSNVPADFTCRPFKTGIAAERTLPLNISANNQIGTLITPFNATLPAGVKAYTCSSLDEEAEELVLTPASSLVACTPYIVYAPNGYSGTISGTVDMDAEYPDTDVYTHGFLTGVLSTTVVNSGYIMQNQGNGPMFYNAEGSSFSLPAGRCYLTPTGSATSKSYRVRIGHTGINEVHNENIGSPVIFDLTGRKVESPTKGIYIIDGKKVLVK